MVLIVRRRSRFYIPGYYMLLVSSVGQPGDRVALVSPRNTFNANSTLTFYYHMWLSSGDTAAELSVYKYSQLHAVEQRLFTDSADRGSSWRKVTVCLPAGTYNLAFVGTIGQNYVSDIGVDGITYDPNPTSCVVPYVVNVSGLYIVVSAVL